MKRAQDTRPPGAAGAYRRLRSRLAGVRRRLRVTLTARCLVQTLATLAAVAIPLFLLDNWLHFPPAMRLAGCAALAGATLAALGAGLRLALEGWSDERVACQVESRFPELNNRLINAVQLGAAPASSGAGALAAVLVDEALAEANRHRLARAVSARGVGHALLAAGALALLTGLYAFLWPERFENAALRILLPTRAIAPLTRIRLEVRPGDARLARGEDLAIQAAPQGAWPPSATVEVRGARGGQRIEMTPGDAGFQYTVAAVGEPLRYRVTGGDFRSRWFEVRLVDKPRVARQAARLEYPAYTGQPPATIDPLEGELAALAGTRVTLRGWTNKPVAQAALAVEPGGTLEARIEPATEAEGPASSLAATFTAERAASLQWRVADAEGLDNAPAPVQRLRVTTDQPPRAAITAPQGPVEAPQGTPLTILYTAADDYGLTRVELKREQGPAVATLKSETPPPATRGLNLGVVLETTGLAPGTTFQIVVEATDNNPDALGAARSEPLTVKITQPAPATTADLNAAAGLFQQLLALLQRQQGLRGDMEQWRVSLADAKLKEEARAGLVQRILIDQSSARVEAIRLVEAAGAAGGWEAVRDGLAALAQGEMREAVGALKGLAAMSGAAERNTQSLAVLEIQAEIIKKLQDLLGLLAQSSPELAAQLAEALSRSDPKPRPRPESLGGLRGDLLDFIDDQKGLVATLQAVEAVSPKDFGTTTTRTLSDLAEVEQDWARYFKDAAEWLREAPMVKGTESGLRDELLEIYSEVEPLPEELRHAPTTINVSADQVGLELAEELVSEMEKWLAEEPDYQKWVLENAPEDYDVPLAQLPDELEDLIGDLIESEQSMSQAIEDQTSNWADSIDKGAGWAVADGPISNYSAKGITGNILPNDIDIAGRAGEGRTGRSLGEMVESVATGKGGRDTPTRMTNDPMGDGVVEDLSTEQTKGATGGGKVSGTTGWGLVSPNAPEQPILREQLARRQADLRQQATSLHDQLVGLRLPSGRLADSIQGMQRVEQAIQDGQYNNLKDLSAVVVGDLKEQRAILRESLRLRLDPSTEARKKLRRQLSQGLPDRFPEQYKALISAYYETLAAQPWQ